MIPRAPAERQSELKPPAKSAVRPGTRSGRPPAASDRPAMRLGRVPGDRQAEPDPLRLAGHERLEQAPGNVRRRPRPGVGDFDDRLLAVRAE